MTDPRERAFGAAKEYDVVPRASDQSDQGYAFHFSEKFYESNNKSYDAILLLGARLNHYTGNMNNILSFLWRGFSKKARAITRLFIKEITVSYSIPSFENLATLDYTGRNSTVGTVDNSIENMPDLASEGVLAELREITGYYFVQATEFDNKSWIHVNLSPKRFVYRDLETTLPLSFYLQSINFDTAKPAWVFWKITAGVRFHGSQKANPKYSKGIAYGGVPS